MKLILVNQRYGHSRTIVIRGWMKGFLSLCLMGAPVALGYLGYELAFAEAGTSSLVSQESAIASDEFIHGDQAVALLEHDASAHDTGFSSEYAIYHIIDNTQSDAATDYYSDFRAFTSNHAILPSLLQSDVVFKLLPRKIAWFQHGRLIDPASYSYRTLH